MNSLVETRQEYQEKEAGFLVSYAQTSRDSRGRLHKEKRHPVRTIFQRDRDRIIHCRAFRRLEYKTQVFINHEGDHYRTRLTHTIEVAQIARNIARALGLNEDLTEAIALAHDVGHAPFGHCGEHALNHLMKDFGGFEHNRQSLRVVEMIEKKYPRFSGLNLSWEVREGIIKHQTSYDRPASSELDPHNHPTLEAQAVEVSDMIAFNTHDLDDGILSGLLEKESLYNVSLWNESYSGVKSEYSGAEEEVIIYSVIRSMIDRLVTDVLKMTSGQLERYNIGSVENVRKAPTRIVSFSKGIKLLIEELQTFLLKNLYLNSSVEHVSDKAQIIISDLFKYYIENPKRLNETTWRKIKGIPVQQVVCDYVAGMTDRFAMKEHQRIFGKSPFDLDGLFL